MSPVSDALLAWAVDVRRDLHAHPEVRFTERRTAAVVAGQLRDLGLTVREGIAGTGVSATWSSGTNGPHVVLRADLDALPVPDLNEVPYASTVPGVAHACGHDVHMAVVLGSARALTERPAPAGRVTFLFQPAEEIPFGEASGAQAVIDTGHFDELDADAVLGLHCWPALPAGTIGIDDEYAMAAKDAFAITVLGRGAHAATPSGGVDAVLAAGHVVTALHHAVSRRLDPAELGALNVGTIHGGHSQSVLADRVELTGTIRTVDDDVRRRLREAVEAAATGAVLSVGARAEVVWANEMPALINDAGLVLLARDVLPTALSGGGVVALSKPPMTTDDFALYARRVPGLYIKLGTAGHDGLAEPLHSSSFDVDESCIGYGVATLDALTRAVIAGGDC